ncbi:branched-chain amino acid ABC transporter permease [Actinomadura algeriensis]|uniref:Branched-chain amino acid transport system permease protein n=1 Tax=Actinomadura algeriensis TaxID=1679523 RepID=A0ABR9JQY9_9ACTN|nr:branched-chain amino acid ABC transporter permease [Actinomadura algeriensis]MBE1532989.1 branched-chain amino acid transport system permease protein [Actinomadura algeriensis]
MTPTLAGVPDAVARFVPPRAARALVLAGAAASIGSTFLPWTWTSEFPGDLTVTGYPGGNQLITLALGACTLLAGAASLRPSRTRWTPLLRGLALAQFASTWYVLLAIAFELGGLVNWVAGTVVALVAVALPLVGALALPDDDDPERSDGRTFGRPVEIAVLFVLTFAAMLMVGYGLATEHTEQFVGFVLAVGFAAWGLNRGGLLEHVSAMAARNRTATALAALAAAVAFAFVQNDPAHMTLAANVLIFGAVALGLNIVVGLSGLLDLGYVAFLGVGAYVAALVSGSVYSRYTGAPLPFWAAVAIGIAVAIVAGVLIGAPTLRVRGDYLAIVTLGFGEIFRITANNLDGVSGPRLTNGPNGVPGVPDLSIFGYDFGEPHTILGVTLGRFSNYYLLLVAVVAICVFVYARVDRSRIGRAWAAIREDETAASAMGVNGFRYKLLAFALGAALAGLAGTVQAHVTTTVTPDQYKFLATAPPNSAFLLAAVVLGGMGTISGPLLGGALLYVIPEKFEFFDDKQLLLFGLTMILMMRLRPEGIVPDRRHRLEFHEREIAESEGRRTAARPPKAADAGAAT